jgi:hypothetical protein
MIIPPLLSSQRARLLLSFKQSSMPCSVNVIEQALTISDTSEITETEREAPLASENDGK